MRCYWRGKAERLRALLRALVDHAVWGAAPPHRHPKRLLLLDRSVERGQGWWAKAFGGTDGEGTAIGRMIDPGSPSELGPIIDPADRRAIFTDALRQATKQATPLGPEHDQALAGLSWGGEPLFLGMAGLYAARNGMPQALALPADRLALDVATEELARIRKVWRANGRPDEAEGFAVHMAAAATLCGGLDREAAEVAIDREKAALRRASVGDAPDVRDALADALQGPEGGIAPILPDILGEAAMVLVWQRQADGEAVAARALATHRPQLVESVVRASRDFAIHGQQAPLVWLRHIVAVTESPPDFDALSDAIPDSTVELREIALQLVQAQVRNQPAGDEEAAQARRAELLKDPSNRLSALGRREDALAAGEETVTSYRRLAVGRPNAFLPDLASSLNNLSVHLFHVGRREDALAATEEALASYRRLIAAGSDAFVPDPAMALNNLSVYPVNLGRREAALGAVEEAVASYRLLAAGRPVAFLPDLAMSLNNLAGLGRMEAALAAIEESVPIRRRLAAARPDVFSADLGRSLALRADVHRGVGDAAAARRDATEALGCVAGRHHVGPAGRHQRFQQRAAIREAI